jgi:hypothetical protein
MLILLAVFAAYVALLWLSARWTKGLHANQRRVLGPLSRQEVVPAATAKNSPKVKRLLPSFGGEEEYRTALADIAAVLKKANGCKTPTMNDIRADFHKRFDATFRSDDQMIRKYMPGGSQ